MATQACDVSAPPRHSSVHVELPELLLPLGVEGCFCGEPGAEAGAARSSDAWCSLISCMRSLHIAIIGSTSVRPIFWSPSKSQCSKTKATSPSSINAANLSSSPQDALSMGRSSWMSSSFDLCRGAQSVGVGPRRRGCLGAIWPRQPVLPRLSRMPNPNSGQGSLPVALPCLLFSTPPWEPVSVELVEQFVEPLLVFYVCRREGASHSVGRCARARGRGSRSVGRRTVCGLLTRAWEGSPRSAGDYAGC